MKTSTGTGAFLVTYTGLENQDYDGEQMIWNVGSAADAESCVFDSLESDDWDATAFTITARELGIDELAELAGQGGDEGEDAQNYLDQLKQLPQFA